VTAGREDWRPGALGQLRTSRADREQAIDVLKVAFVQGRLTKDEFDLRVGQVFASRTYADLGALTADIPGWVTSAQPAAEQASEPGRMLSFKTAASVGAVGAGPSMASAAVVMMQSSSVPAVAGVLLVGLTGVFVTGLLAALLMLLSWIVRRSRRKPAQGPPPGPAGLASKRQAPARQLPPVRHGPGQLAVAGAAWPACGLVRPGSAGAIPAGRRRVRSAPIRHRLQGIAGAGLTTAGKLLRGHRSHRTFGKEKDLSPNVRWHYPVIRVRPGGRARPAAPSDPA
jgi:membrane protein implicated in regulation of membrane protease activity